MLYEVITEKQREKVEKKLEKQTLKIVKSDGEKENFDIEKVKNTYKRVSYKLARKCRFEELEASLKKYIVEGMKTSDILKMMIKSSIDLISVENTSWQFIAGRLQLLDIYKHVITSYSIHYTKLYDLLQLSWSEMRDSNSQPHGPKPCALPIAPISDI